MAETCMTCGLPMDLCVCETIAKEQQKVRVYVDKRRYGKPTTILEGIDSKNIDLKDLIKKLKQKLACGGTLKAGVIELQGNHKDEVKEVLTKIGFSENSIEME